MFHVNIPFKLILRNKPCTQTFLNNFHEKLFCSGNLFRFYYTSKDNITIIFGFIAIRFISLFLKIENLSKLTISFYSFIAHY